ncbi:hypothetical protein BGX31_000683 [Mortierella sp. GBA43]|nr:hypothetical protein BGX31_000683 [Mortierella sp. GBA43]
MPNPAPFFVAGHPDQQLPLKRETTEDMSKMYTTLYDMDDPQQQQEFSQLLQQQLQQDPQGSRAFIDSIFNQTPATWVEPSPASPALSCFSGSSSSCSGSAHSSPAYGSIKTIDADEADALVDMFHITIDELLNPLAPLQHADGVMNTPDFTLFAPPTSQPMMTAAALHFPCESTMECQQPSEQYYHNQTMHRPCSASGSIGPQRSGSLSPIMSCAPYPATQHQNHRPILQQHSSSSTSHSSSRNRYTPHTPELQYNDMPHSPMNTYAPTSPSPCTSPAVPSTPFMSPMTPTTPTAAFNINNNNTTPPPQAPVVTAIRLPNTDGMTVIKNEDGSIMVYNPQTESMTFRCELCPNESFGRIHDLKRHQTSKHQEMTWPCEFCQRPFVRRDALLRHYTVKSTREDGVHPASHETEKLMAARARAKLIC